MSFCPLHCEATIHGRLNTPNLGLIFNKYPDGWTKNGSKYEFDSSGTWLKEFAGRVAGERDLILEACLRQRRLAQAHGGLVVCVKNVSRFCHGLGNAHPSENGLTWHPTLGTPYLPGSSLKGVLRAWDRENEGIWGPTAIQERGETLQGFGTQQQVGNLIFLDMLPVEPVAFAREILTPHYGSYYSSKGEQTAPGDWDKPNPIEYLAVKEGVKWQIAILFHDRATKDEAFWANLPSLVTEALDWAGAGAKTSSGFGRFERDQRTEQQWQRDTEKEQQQADIQRQEHATKIAKEATYAAMSPALADIRKALDQLMSGGQPDPEKFPEKLEAYLAGRTELAPEVVAWLKTCFEQRDPTLWSEPDRVQGKKGKPVHKPRWVNLVKEVKRLAKP